ncbi:MAG: DUF932 domain-containing protein [Lentisphaerae bacterium]|nr:DUF932 domain-containing protein [Lentisphaerota bacterium]
MAANLDRRENGEAAVFVVGEPAWHGEGMVFDHPPTLVEAIETSGLDFEVEKEPLVVHRVDNARDIDERFEVPNKFLTVRTDRTGADSVLGVVGKTYHVVSNKNAWDFFDHAVEAGDVVLESAGALDGGRTSWILAKLPEVVKIGRDISEPYVLLSNSFDGSRPVIAGFNAVRVVCQNTHNMAFASMAAAGNQIRIRHCASAHEKLREAKRVLLHAKAYYEAYAEAGTAMLETRITGQQLHGYFETLYPDPAPNVKTNRVNQRAANVRDTLEDLHSTGPGAERIRGTAWGAFNAVSRFADHGMALRDSTSNTKNIWFGAGSRLKQRAFDNALALVKVA